MNFKKIVASVAAAAVAVSAMAISTFAKTTNDYIKDNTVYVTADKEADPNLIADTGLDITTIYGVTYYVTFNEAEVADPAVWIGGGIGANSPSTGWKQIEWGRADKTVIADLENGKITWLSDAPVFKDSDNYAQFWLQTWGGTVTVTGADILDKDGNAIDISALEAPAAEDDAAAATDDAATDDAATDDAATDDAADVADTTADEDVDLDDVADIDDAAEDDAADDAADVATDDSDAAADDADVADTTADAPAADADTTASSTGNTSAAVILSVMAVAGAAAIVAKKRK